MSAHKSKLRVNSTRLLSNRGSTRATRYAGTNKIVTRDSKTHITWLDSISDTMISTYDRTKGSWTHPVKVGSGYDNHGGGALTCDSMGYLHLFFGPHGQAPFLHYQSTEPNDATQWVKLPAVGANATYPSVVCDNQDTLHLIYRGGEHPRQPFSLLYQQRKSDSIWSPPIMLAKAPDDWNGYTHYHHALTIAQDNTLHIGYNIYYDGRAQHAFHMMSPDQGQSWTLADNSPVALPVKVSKGGFFESTDDALKVNSIVCDSQGHPWLSLSHLGAESALRIYHHDGERWHFLEPGRLTQPTLEEGDMGNSGVLTISQDNHLYLITCVKGHVAVLESSALKNDFRVVPAFPPSETLPHVGLTLERPTGHHAVDVPFGLFSTGEKGPDCFGLGIFHSVYAVELSF
jgi:hypothetical protein